MKTKTELLTELSTGVLLVGTAISCACVGAHDPPWQWQLTGTVLSIPAAAVCACLLGRLWIKAVIQEWRESQW